MRRFLCIIADGVHVGASNSSEISDATYVAAGQVAVLKDEDPRCDGLAYSPYFREVDEDNNPVEHSEPEPDEVPVPDEPAPAPEEEQEPQEYPATVHDDEDESPEHKTRKRRVKPEAESEVGG